MITFTSRTRPRGNGNATRDENRGIGAGGIRYNILNLPREISVNSKTLSYHYDATGSKVRMQNNTDNTKYAGAFEYNNGNYLTRIAVTTDRTEEGQISIINNGANASDYSFEYYLRDHLGNTRPGWRSSGDERGGYYGAGDSDCASRYLPFGLAIPRTAGTNKYPGGVPLYNGKEKQPETGLLDYGARQYDATIGRWMVVDPLAEKYYSYSPYVYAINDPVLLNDPDGRDIDVSRFKSKEEQALLKQFLSTKAGYSFFAQFANKGDKIGGLTFKEAGERSNDLLVVQSTDHVNMVTDNGQTSTYEKKNPSDNTDRPGSIYGKSLQNADKDTDIAKGVIHLIRINQEQSDNSKLNTLSHEAFVHVQEDINRLRALQNNKAVKPGTTEYIRQLQHTGTSSVVDHTKLGQGKVQGYQNISAQLDKLNRTGVFTELYKRDVRNHKGN